MGLDDGSVGTHTEPSRITDHASRFTHLQPISSCSSVSYSEGRVDDDSLAKASFMKGGAANVVITAIANTTPYIESLTAAIATPICATTMPTSPRGIIP